MLNEIFHALRYPIPSSDYPPNNHTFPVNEESRGMAPDPISICYLSPIIKQEGGSNIEFAFKFDYIFLRIFNSHFKNDKVLAFKQLIQFSERRRLLPASFSPGGIKIEDNHLSPKFFQRDFSAPQLLQLEIRSCDRGPELCHSRLVKLSGRSRGFP